MNSQSFNLRAATPDDEAFLLQVFADTRPEFDLLDEGQKLALLKMQYNIRQLQYDDAYPQAESMIVIQQDLPVGRILVAEGEREFTLIDIALLSGYRNSGIGSHLIRQLLDRARAAGKPVRLQVLKSNPARHLYERLGFEMVEEQSMYVEMKYKPNNGGS